MHVLTRNETKRGQTRRKTCETLETGPRSLQRRSIQTRLFVVGYRLMVKEKWSKAAFKLALRRPKCCNLQLGTHRGGGGGGTQQSTLLGLHATAVHRGCFLCVLVYILRPRPSGTPYYILVSRLTHIHTDFLTRSGCLTPDTCNPTHGV